MALPLGAKVLLKADVGEREIAADAVRRNDLFKLDRQEPLHRALMDAIVNNDLTVSIPCEVVP